MLTITVDGQNIIDLTDDEVKLIKNDINEDIFTSDMERRVRHAISEGTDPAEVIRIKIRGCKERLNNQWQPKFAKEGKPIPEAESDFFGEVWKHADYKSRKQRDAV